MNINSKVKIIDTSCHSIPLGSEGVVVPDEYEVICIDINKTIERM